MKHVTRILALLLVVTTLCVMLVACGAKPEADPTQAKGILEKNGYEVELTDDPSMLLTSSFYYGGQLTAMLSASKDTDYVKIFWFEEKEDAEEYYDFISDQMSSLQYAFGVEENMIWYGTKDGVKAASDQK
ncbi:MAG: hypothetical protein IJY22_05130 [Clostridia bacterium]|nr:hypothetical protein [Clostridia bacterium]